jgi:hypothetical protein
LKLYGLLLIAFFVIWLITGAGIPEYVAAASPFLYILSFVPQFWLRTRATKRDEIEPEMVISSNEMDIGFIYFSMK